MERPTYTCYTFYGADRAYYFIALGFIVLPDGTIDTGFGW